MAYCVKTAISSLHCSSHLSRASYPVRGSPQAAASNIRLYFYLQYTMHMQSFLIWKKKTSIRITLADNIMAHSTSVNTLFWTFFFLLSLSSIYTAFHFFILISLFIYNIVIFKAETNSHSQICYKQVFFYTFYNSRCNCTQNLMMACYQPRAKCQPSHTLPVSETSCGIVEVHQSGGQYHTATTREKMPPDIPSYSSISCPIS